MLLRFSHAALRSGAVNNCRAFSAARDAGYIDKISSIPSFHYQPSLPRLPLPLLNDTLEQYLENVTTLVKPAQWQNTKAIVERFEKGVGKELHHKLVMRNHANSHTSFISAPWFEKYLKDRTSLMINTNPQITLENDPVPEKNDQLIRAAALLASSCRFYRSLKDKVLAPDVFHTKPETSESDMFESVIRRVPSFMSWYGAFLAGAYPLDMSQYKGLFFSTRIPGQQIDRIEAFTGRRHVAVIRGADYFVFDVLQEDGMPVPEGEILSQLQSIMAAPASPPSAPHLSALTSADRVAWATAREELLRCDEGGGNAAGLDAIDSALFVLTLEDAAPEGPVEVGHTMLHGVTHNRWYDKSFNLIVAANGLACVNFEHAWGDGVAVMRYINEVYADSNKTPMFGPTPPRCAPARQLHFSLTPTVETAIRAAEQDAQARIASLSIQTMQSEQMSRNIMKQSRAGVGADAVQQLAFQLAFYRQNGFTAPTYESASTSAYKHGRTETIRPASVEAAAFVSSMQDWGATRGAKLGALKKASDKHGEMTKACLMGAGCDRHLFALRHLAEEMGVATPDFFHDPTYEWYNHNLMSTSTLASPAISNGGFGPVVQDGYGIGYSMREHDMGTIVSCYDAPKLADFLKHLEGAVKDIRGVMDTADN